MNGKYNIPRLMGNCVRCYYATYKRKDGSCVCSRYPKWVDVSDMENHFCGEFSWYKDTSLLKDGDAE